MTRLFFSNRAQKVEHLGTFVKPSYNSRKRTSYNAYQCRHYSPPPRSQSCSSDSPPNAKKNGFPTTYHDLPLPATTWRDLTRPKLLTPANSLELSQTSAQPSPRRESSPILKILENPANPDSDNHASPQRTPQKCCFSLPHPIELHALWVCDAGGQLPKAPVQQEMTLNSFTALPGQMIFPPIAWQTIYWCCLHQQDHTCLFADPDCHHSRSEASVKDLLKSSPAVPASHRRINGLNGTKKESQRSAVPNNLHRKGEDS